MDDVIIASTDNASVAPNKKVNYAFGMVLGVDDFKQEQTHSEWHHRQHSRLLHGYGTVCGLHVDQQIDENDELQIIVSDGYAVSPRGNLIWVDRAMCAWLQRWIDANQESLIPDETSIITVYINLCHDEVPTDLVPVAGQACAPIGDSQAPSRLQETFWAELSTQRPSQTAEDTIRYFGDLLGRIEIVADLPSPLEDDDRDRLIAIVRDLPGLPSPPDEVSFLLYEATACETIQTLLTIWATEVCPRLDPAGDDCILLACLQFELDGLGNLDEATLTIDNCDRPILVPSRLQQELFCLSQGISDHGGLIGLEDDDHPQYLRTDGNRPLEGEWSAGGHKITELGTAVDDGDAVRYDQLLSHEHALDDLTDVEAPAPSDGELLTWNTDHWEPGPNNLGHDHALDALSDVNAAAPGTDQVLAFDGTNWVPTDATTGGAEVLNDLDDVDAAAPDEGNTLRFRSGAWVPEAMPEGVTGNFVQAPAGDYAIVAAGILEPDGNPISSYNELKGTPLGDGHYLLDFPLFFELLESGLKITYIVKGTIIDPDLPDYLEDPHNPDFLSMSPPVFQVVAVTEKGIEVMITQPMLRFERLIGLVNEKFDIEQDRNVIWLAPVLRRFMVEISAYGEGLAGSLDKQVNINTASEAELRSLPRIGPAIAQDIIAVREAEGPFASVADLSKVSGLSDFLIGQLTHLIRV